MNKKNQIHTMMFFASFLSVAVSANAQMDRGNGGDPDVGKFRKIGSEIQSWINGGYADRIILPPGINLKTYKSEMNAAFDTYHVSFVNRVVTVRGLQRMCINTNTPSAGKQIVCNRYLIERVLKTEGDEIYQLIHHEVAGLAGLEVNVGQESDTRISDQVTKKVVVNRLPVELGKSGYVAFAKAEGSVNSCVGRALNRYLRKEFNVGWDVKIASYANQAQRSRNYRRKCSDTLFEWYIAESSSGTDWIHPNQLAHEMSSAEIINGWKKEVATGPDTGASIGCSKMNSVTPVIFKVLVKVNDEEMYDADVTLASLDRTTEFITDKETFYCSLKNVKLVSKKSGIVVLNQ
jgi:hypothetical protein